MRTSQLALLAFIIATTFCGVCCEPTTFKRFCWLAGLVRLTQTYQDYTEANNITSFHPLMQPFIFFLSSAMCITVYIFKTKNPRFIVKRKNFKWRYLLVPALLFFINVFQNVIAIKYLYNGLYSIMKSISLISNVAMEKCFYPHRSYTKNQFAGLILVVIGLAIMGIYSLILTQNMDIIDINNSVEINIIFGITLLLISIFPMAFYYLLQERFMKAFKIDPFQYVGTQGAVNSLITLVLILSFQWLPCSNKTCQLQVGNNYYLERVDIWWDQLTSNYFFLYTTLILFLFFAIQMYLEFFIMKTYSGIACNMISTLYLLIPYIYVLIIGKLPFDFVIIGGFLVLITGVLIFYHIPNFSSIENLNSYTSSAVTVPDFRTEIHGSSLEDQFNPTITNSQEPNGYQLEENVKNESSNSSKKQSKNKQSQEINQNSSIYTNSQERYHKQQQQIYNDQYIPPNQMQYFNSINKYDQKIQQQYQFQQNQQNNHEMNKKQKLNTAINNVGMRNELVYLDSNNYNQQQRQYSQIDQAQNQVNYVQKPINQQILFKNKNNKFSNSKQDFHSQQNRISNVESNSQYQNIQKSQNSQSNNEDDDSSIYYNNKFLRNKGNSKSNATQFNQNTINSFNDNNENDYFNSIQTNQNIIYQQNEQQNNEQNDQNSVISSNNNNNNHYRISRYSGSGLWINQSNQRNKSNLYDQSILLLNSQISEQNQSSILYKEITLRQQNNEKIQDKDNNQNQDAQLQQEEESEVKSSQYLQRDFELLFDNHNKDDHNQQYQNEQQNFQSAVEQQLQDQLQQQQAIHNKSTQKEILRKKSSISNKSMPGRKQKSDKKLLIPQNNFQEDIVLNQNDISIESYDDLLFDQNSSQNEILMISKSQQNNSNIPSPSISPINVVKKNNKKQNRKLLILNL